MITKGIIVVDVPEKCEDCACCHTNDYNYWCQLNGKSVDWETRPDRCPIRPLPEKIGKVALSDMGYKHGWNACIDEILKEES